MTAQSKSHHDYCCAELLPTLRRAAPPKSYLLTYSFRWRTYQKLLDPIHYDLAQAQCLQPNSSMVKRHAQRVYHLKFNKDKIIKCLMGCWLDYSFIVYLCYRNERWKRMYRISELADLVGLSRSIATGNIKEMSLQSRRLCWRFLAFHAKYW